MTRVCYALFYALSLALSVWSCSVLCHAYDLISKWAAKLMKLLSGQAEPFALAPPTYHTPSSAFQPSRIAWPTAPHNHKKESQLGAGSRTKKKKNMRHLRPHQNTGRIPNLRNKTLSHATRMLLKYFQRLSNWQLNIWVEVMSYRWAKLAKYMILMGIASLINPQLYIRESATILADHSCFRSNFWS